MAQEIIQVADTGDWKGFTEKMGGVFCMRKVQVFQPYYEFSIDKESGNIKTSQYSDDGFITRVLEWRIDSQVQKVF